MKKNYQKPTMQAEAFVANTYCADCSDESHTMVTYIFQCGYGLGRNTEYWIHDGNGNYATIDGHYYGPRDGIHNQRYYYHRCSSYHEITVPKSTPVESLDDVLFGYYLDDRSTNRVESIEVAIWTENHTNLHATIQTNPTEWQTTKS
ncbi:MAG: hypothetical protein IKH69_00240 [Bacteroidaceae bacterium]|nr:hypothetical protein [Bacteroidaceae bacterium]